MQDEELNIKCEKLLERSFFHLLFKTSCSIMLKNITQYVSKITNLPCCIYIIRLGVFYICGGRIVLELKNSRKN